MDTMMKLLILAAVITSISCRFRSDIQRVNRQASDLKPIWHLKFENSARTPELKAVYSGSKLKICYRLDVVDAEGYGYTCRDTTNFYQFEEAKVMKFAPYSHLDGLIYDDNKIGKPSNLSLRSAYPAYIAITQKSASSSVDDNGSWVKTCDRCVDSTITSSNSEIYKSNDGSFWASFNDNNRIITSTNMTTWQMHANLNPDVKLHNIFPIVDANGNSKWVLVQVFTSPATYYQYYLGTITHGSGFSNERLPYNISYGVDDIEVFFASKGDVVTKEQYMLPTLINTYVEEQSSTFFRSPVILGMPRIVTFKGIGGVQRLVQVPALDWEKITKTQTFSFQDKNFTDGALNPIRNIRTTSCFINFSFDLKESKEVGINIRMSQDETERTQIGYLIGDIFYVDRSNSGLPPGNLTQDSLRRYKRRMDVRERVYDRSNIQFQIYLDGNSLEVFYDQGQANTNLLIFPSPTSDRLTIFTSRDETILKNFQLITYD